jgi:hypothetical protein
MTHKSDTRSTTRVPQTLALLIGVGYLALAVVGFMETGTNDFTRNPENVVLGFGVSTLHNVVHAAAGLLAVVLGRTASGARAFGWLALIGFTALSAYGIPAAIGEGPGEPLNVNWADNVLHLGTALVALVIVLIGERADRSHP